MKKPANLVAAVAVIALFFTTNVNAQTTLSNTWRLGIGLENGLSTGSVTSRSKYELGGTARLQYGVSNNFALTLTSGLYNFFGIEQANLKGKHPNLDIIPVKAGLKAFFAPDFYFGAEAGAGFVQNNGNTKFIYSPALGYANKTWDVGVRYENFSGGQNGIDANYGIIGLRIAYCFGL